MMSDEQTGTAILTRPKLQPPPMYTVVFLNDDYTPMDFVVHVLMQYFNLAQEAAVIVMLKVHREGKANVGRYTCDVANHKVDLVMGLAKQHQHPLTVFAEKIV